LSSWRYRHFDQGRCSKAGGDKPIASEELLERTLREPRDPEPRLYHEHVQSHGLR